MLLDFPGFGKILGNTGLVLKGWKGFREKQGRFRLWNGF
jgi:hypothetical protein